MVAAAATVAACTHTFAMCSNDKYDAANIRVRARARTDNYLACNLFANQSGRENVVRCSSRSVHD